MSKCGYKTKIKGKSEQFFDSEKDLDRWVEENYFLRQENLERLRKYTKGKTFLFDTDEDAEAQVKALSKVQSITDKLAARIDKVKHDSFEYSFDPDSDDFEVVESSAVGYKHLASVTKFLNTTGNWRDYSKASVTGSNEDDYIKYFREQLRNEMWNEKDPNSPYNKWIATHGTSDESKANFEIQVKDRIEDLVKKYKQKRKYARLIGEDIHKLMEYHAKKKMGEDSKLTPGYILTPTDQSKALDITKEIFDNVCKRYNFSEEAQFFPEFDIFGENLNSSSRRQLEQALKTNIEGLFGRIDLLVVDKGKVYVFDFKTTAEKQVHDWQIRDGGNNKETKENGWWTSSKKLEAMQQVAMYLALLEQHGLEVGGGEVIPINIDYKLDSDGYPIVDTKNVGKNGKELLQASQETDITNINWNKAGLALDTSAEDTWNESQRLKRSSAALIDYMYLPWARGQAGLIKPLDLKETKDHDEAMEYIFPSRIDTGKKEFSINVDYYLGKDEEGKKVRDSRVVALDSKDSHRNMGFTYRMFTSPKINLYDYLSQTLGEREAQRFAVKYSLSEKAGSIIYFKTNDEEEVRPILEHYCAALKENIAAEFNNFANDFHNIMQLQGRDESMIKEAIGKLVNNDPIRAAYTRNMLSKYMNGDWELYGWNDPENALIQKGVFIFYKDYEVEIAVLSHDVLHRIVNFGTKKHPLQTVLNGIDHSKWDSHNILASSYGNMLLIKAMDIISRNPEIYRNGEAKIRAITAINPWHCTSAYADNDTLYENWTKLVQLSKGKLHGIPKFAFMDSVQSCISQAKDILVGSSMYPYLGSNYFDNPIEKESQIMKLIDLIKEKEPTAFDAEGIPKIDNKVGYSVWCLMNAMLLNRKLHIPIEHDKGKILQGSAIPSGTYIQTPGSSASLTMRTLDQLTAQFRSVYSNIYNGRIDDLQKHVKIIYDKCGFNPNTMSRKDFWAQFFEKEGNTNRVAKQMRIINFANPFWDRYKHVPEVKESFRYILDTWAAFKRIPLTKECPTYEMSDTDKYYEVPLLRAGFVDDMSTNIKQKGIRGAFDVVEYKIQKAKEKINQFTRGDDEVYVKKSLEDKDSQDILNGFSNGYCQYSPEQRADMTKSDAVTYSTDFEAILGTTLLAESLRDASETYKYLYAGIRTALALNEKIGGESIPELQEAVRDYITARYKGESIINTSNQAFAKMIGVVKGITSKMALGFNSRAFAREMLVSWYTGTLRANAFQIEGVNGEDFAFGFKYVIGKAPANIDKIGFLGQLNRRFQMAGQSREELAEANFINDFALRTVDMENLAYMGTTIPDNYFRTAILIGRMHHEGCFDAYYMDNEGVLKYDPKKDNRFSKYLTDTSVPIFKEYDSSMGSYSAYADARALWDRFMDEWRTVYPNENYQTLPEAFPPSYIRAIQESAGKLYGYFDSDQKSLMCSQFIGSVLMQYKTWLSAKIDQWLQKPGFINVWRQVRQTDENGNPLFIVAHTAEEIKEGKPVIEFLIESELTDEMKTSGRAVPYIIEQGTFTEGMLWSGMDFATAILGYNDQTFLEMWNDPVKRGNFICGFIDMFGMMLFAGLVNLIFGDDVKNNKRAQAWITQWTYGVLMGFAEDGPIHQVLGGMVGDWNPPSLVTIQQLAKTTQSVMAGNKTLPQGFVESFGATREFSGFFKQ